MTAVEFRAWLEANGRHDAVEDIFYTTDLRLPPGQRVARDPALIEAWISNFWPEAPDEGKGGLE